MKTTPPLDLIDTLQPDGPEMREINEATSAIVSCHGARSASRPAWGTHPIRCGKTKCKWRGYEGDRVSVPHKRIEGLTAKVCPTCGCDSYLFMTEREIASWKRTTAAQEGGAA